MLNFTTPQRNVNHYHTDIIIQVRQGYNQTDFVLLWVWCRKSGGPQSLYQCKNDATILRNNLVVPQNIKN